MKDLAKILKTIDGIVETYEGGTWSTVDNLRAMLRELTSNMYYLTKYNIEFHKDHNAIQYKHKGSVAGGIILANEQCPELRKSRKILDAADNVKGSIIMEISTINKES